MTDNILFDEKLTRKGSLVLRALLNDKRQKIMRLIHQNQKLTVTGIYTHLRLEQPVASQHLRILRDARLVTCHRDGKKIYYHIDYNRLESIQKAAAAVVSLPSQEKESTGT